MNKSHFEQFKDNIVTDFDKDEIVVTENGSMLVKNTPKVAPKAYLHYLFNPMPKLLLATLKLENCIGCT